MGSAMPSVSPAQHNFFEAIAHNGGFAKKAGVKQSVGRDFIEADKSAGKFKSRKERRNGKARA